MGKDMNKEFCIWLCGFIDGEGCFVIHRHKTFNTYQARFSITLRADDIDILRKISQELGVGNVRWRDGCGWKNNKQHPQVEYRLYNINDCDVLIKHIEYGGGLRAKKARDFMLFKDFLEHKKSSGRKWRSDNQKSYEFDMHNKICDIKKFAKAG